MNNINFLMNTINFLMNILISVVSWLCISTTVDTET